MSKAGKKRGRPATGKYPMLSLRAPRDLTRRVEALAEAEPDKPSRSEMLRRLIEHAIELREQA